MTAPIDCAISTRHVNFCDGIFRDYVKPVLIFCAGVFIGCCLCGIIVRVSG